VYADTLNLKQHRDKLTHWAFFPNFRHAFAPYRASRDATAAPTETGPSAKIPVVFGKALQDES
jgi:hypothetical protein